MLDGAKDEGARISHKFMTGSLRCQIPESGGHDVVKYSPSWSLVKYEKYQRALAEIWRRGFQTWVNDIGTTGKTLAEKILESAGRDMEEVIRIKGELYWDDWQCAGRDMVGMDETERLTSLP